MPGLDICLSPDLIHHYSLENTTVVVVDILRATSCMTAGMANGVKEIRPFTNLDECRAMKPLGYLIAGERNGEKLPDFDLGNSPFDYMSDFVSGSNVAVTTTNGTVAIQKSQGAAHILIGSFLNISAITKRVQEIGKDVLIFCAGWKGKVNLEDTLFAGALMDMLKDSFSPGCDAPRVALGSYLHMKDDLYGNVIKSSHAERLKRLNIQKDIAYCLQFDEFDVVPEVMDGKIIPADL
jgi:2-phosphosulfolactate phosphatase